MRSWRIGAFFALIAALSGLASAPTRADSVFEQNFCSQSGCQIPDSPAAIRQKLDELGRKGSDPGQSYDPKNPAPEGVLSLLIPDGRSLQRKNADLDNPRVVMTISPSFQSPLAGKLYMGYSANGKSVEVISWDAAAGRFQFLTVSGYPKGPLVYKKEGEKCLACHQNGGPIFTPAPWNESSSSLAVAKQLCEHNKDTSTNPPTYRTTYQGIPFADKCPDPSRGIPPATVSKQSRVPAALFDTTVRSANRLVQARAACRKMCPDEKCRRDLVESALRKPVASDFFQPPDFSTIANPSSELTNLTTRAITYREQQLGQALRKATAQSWNGGFPYPSSVIPDRDPQKNPPTINTNQAVTGGTPQPLKDQLDDPNYDEGRTLGIDIPGTQKRAGLQITAVDNPDYMGTEGDPARTRPLVSAIPKGLAGTYAVNVAFDCLGFTADDAATIKCCEKFGDKIDKILDSPRVKKILTSWPLSSDDSAPGAKGELRVAVMNSVRENCGLSPDLVACSGAIDAVLSRQNDRTAKDMTPVTSQVPAGTAQGKRNVLKLAKTYCGACHTAPNPKSRVDLHLNEPDKFFELAGTMCSEMRGGDMPPPGKNNPQPNDQDRLEMYQELGCTGTN